MQTFSPFRAASGIEAYHFVRTSLTKTLMYGLKSTPSVVVRISTGLCGEFVSWRTTLTLC
jgi:hypothetical protein